MSTLVLLRSLAAVQISRLRDINARIRYLRKRCASYRAGIAQEDPRAPWFHIRHDFLEASIEYQLLPRKRLAQRRLRRIAACRFRRPNAAI